MSNGQLWKIWKETALIELCSFSIDILALEIGKLCPGVGSLFRFSTRGPEFFTEKLSPGLGFWRKKLVARGLAGGMVTGQIDTCIRESFQLKRRTQLVHNTGNKLYIDDYLLKIPIYMNLPQYPPETEKFLTYLLSQVNFLYH